MSSTRTDSSAILIDTDLLIYGFDPRDSAKQAHARVLMPRLIASGHAVLSVQCLSEFFTVATTRLPRALSLDEAGLQIIEFARAFRVLDLSLPVVLAACEEASRRSISIWDALIWAAARLNGVPVVLTEDAEDGLFRDGVLYRNPFAPGFDPRQIGI
ncbi:MAG: PIN domain-containing protein [Chloroflexi bacterium]|nr:PIN domain-containing protein [Chloroflexota bacterium]